MAGPVIHALIPAAGRSSRFGGEVLKQYLPVAGKSVLAHAIDAVNFHPEISGITVVLAADDSKFSDHVDVMRFGISTVTGGATRAESVMNGLRFIQAEHPETQWVLIHDAARPCLPRTCLENLLKKGLQEPDGALLAIPVHDTLKRIDAAGYIVQTVNRKALWVAQTPQLFPLGRLSLALSTMLANGKSPTDEAGAMEYTGARPLLVMGSPLNIKITWPDDMTVAAAWFAGRNTGHKGLAGDPE